MDVKRQMKITNFFLTISEWDRHVELTRQFVNAMDSFEPYAAYLRLNNGTGKPLTISNLSNFLEENEFLAEKRPLKAVLRLFDTRMEDELDFEDFLKMILSRDNPTLRFNAVSNPNYEVDTGEKLSEEIEYTMARFFHKASSFLKRIMDDRELQLVIDDEDLFKAVDFKNEGSLTFENLKAFFSRSKIALRDDEIVSILRAIDVNDDGMINQEEFEFFISLFKGEDPDRTIVTALKQKSVKDANFFGEKSGIGSDKKNEFRSEKKNPEKKLEKVKEVVEKKEEKIEFDDIHIGIYKPRESESRMQYIIRKPRDSNVKSKVSMDYSSVKPNERNFRYNKPIIFLIVKGNMRKEGITL